MLQRIFGDQGSIEKMEYAGPKLSSGDESFFIEFGDRLSDHHLTNRQLHRITDRLRCLTQAPLSFYQKQVPAVLGAMVLTCALIFIQGRFL